MEEKIEEKFDPTTQLKKYVNAIITMSSLSKKSDNEIKEELKEILVNDISNLEASIKSLRQEEGLSINESNRRIASKNKKVENINSVLEIYDQQIEEIIKNCRLKMSLRNMHSNKSKSEDTEQMVEKILKKAQEKHPILQSEKSEKSENDEEIEI